MANLLQQAGAASEPSSFAPLHTNRIFTGLWTNRNVLRDAATSDYQERYGMGRQDSILTGHNSEITSRLTLRRRAGSSVYNANAIPPVNRFYSFNTFSLTTETIRVMADTATSVYDATAGGMTRIFDKTAGAGPTFFLGVGNVLYFTNGVDRKQWNYGSNQVWQWGINAPTPPAQLSQVPVSNPNPSWSASTAYTTSSPWIVDQHGYFQAVYQAGTSGSAIPNFSTAPGTLTTDGTGLIWQNAGPFSPGSTAPLRYGFAYKNSANQDVSNMSPATYAITVLANNNVKITGPGSGDNQVDKIVLYRTAQGGSTFLFLAEIANPGIGNTWEYTDSIPDSGLNPQIQAQTAGQGTPLPAGATCLAYHVGRIFAAVGNVVYASSGPDAIVSTSSGNAGFNTTFTAQSKITRFWTCSLGLIVFTVRDAYIILGSGTASDPLYMVTFIEQLPLLHYDAFTVNKTTPMLMLGNNMVVALDPSAGIVEVGFPIADRFEEEFDPSTAFVTYHSQSSRESALYVASGNGYWYRMNQNNAPEQGSAWSTRANIAGMGCVQSVEVTPGVYRLLYSGNTTGPIMQRDLSVSTDNGAPYPVSTVFGSIVMAQPGQLAAISFITLESVRVGTRAGLALLLGEISGPFEELNRTRQDPTNLPPSTTLFSDRYHFAQNQQTAWCRHFQMEISWPPEDAANELLTFTIFGQTWQEMRSQ